MFSAQQLAEAYGRNVGIIKAQTADLTHEDSLLQLPFRGNCLNWIVGHIVDSRNGVLAALGAEPALDPAAATRYAPSSAPILADGPDVLPLAELLRSLERSQEYLAAKMAALTDADLAKEVPFVNRTMPLGQLLTFLYFHDTYHTGQAEPLRQLAGKNDKVI